MNRKLICIVCPIGCTLDVHYNDEEVLTVQGNLCLKGSDYAEKELLDPRGQERGQSLKRG